jgi:hypothetical protein
MIRLQFDKPIRFGDDVFIDIAKAGDYLHRMILRVQWPTDAPTTVQPCTGTAMIDRAELVYRDQTIERVYGETMYIQGEIDVPQAKQAALNSFLGKNTTSNLQTYYIQFPFSMLKKGFPIIALDEPPRLRIVFKDSTFFMSSGYYKSVPMDLYGEYTYVSKEEREYLKANRLFYPVRTFQRLQFNVDPNVTSATLLTSFVNNVKELFWVLQPQLVTNVYNYSQITNIQMFLDNNEVIRSDVTSDTYLRVVQPLEYHARVPESNIYMYSFELDPTYTHDTGSVNLSNYTQRHVISFPSSMAKRQLRAYAHSYNIFVVDNGVGRVLYPISEASYDTKQESITNVLPQNTAATGGTITFYTSPAGIQYKVHTFTTSGTFTVSSLPVPNVMKFLVVGGGGAGGTSYNSFCFTPCQAGGGGAGGVFYNTNVPVPAVGSYSVVVGNGGQTAGSNGSSSSFLTVLAPGGGGGGTLLYPDPLNAQGQDGGSGGGNGAPYFYINRTRITPVPTNATAPALGGYGNGSPGIQNGCGGGGAGTPGAAPAGDWGSFYGGGNGGDGLPFDITGASLYYGGGGGGCAKFESEYLGTHRGYGGLGGGGNGGSFDGIQSLPGTPNTGGGGGGHQDDTTTFTGQGGSGVVIISYPVF